MRVGLRFYTDRGATMLWTTLRPGTPDPARWGRITRATIAYADMEITEAKVTIAAPSDGMVRAMLAVCVPEATPLDLGLDLLCGSIWVQDVRFGYEPQPVFYGNILALDDSFSGGSRTLTVTIHDFKRLINLSRDLQDYQNLTDDSIAQMLAGRLNEVLAQAGDVSLGQVIVDQTALAQRRTSSSFAAVRRFNARNVGRLLKSTELDQLRVATRALGFTIKVQMTTNPEEPDAPFQKLTFAPIGELEKTAGTYALGDGEVISFAPRYSPPGPVLQRNAMNKRFDAVNEIMQIEGAKDCLVLDSKNMIKDKNDNILPRDAITSPVQLTDSQGNHVTLSEYQKATRPTFTEGLKLLSPNSGAKLRAYHDRISYRKGLYAPGQAPGPMQQNSSEPAKDFVSFVESAQETGELFWRITGRLVTRFNPLLTTTDFLDLKGFGVWDGAWGIRSFTHTISETPQSEWNLTFGDAIKSG